MAKVELKGIGKIYDGNVRAVENANIVIEDQEFVVFVGPSGCGKSTTLRMVAGLEEISEGDLYIDGERMNDVPPKDRNIAMVFQNYALYPHMTVYDNMAFGLKIRKVDKQEIERRVHEAARILDIEKLLDRKPKALSGGQRQRLSIARAVFKNPPILILDEATSALDTTSERLVQNALDHLMSGRTTIVIAHRLSTIIHADVICVVDGGRIVEQGTHEELLALGGHYAKLHAIQMKA